MPPRMSHLPIDGAMPAPPAALGRLARWACPPAITALAALTAITALTEMVAIVGAVGIAACTATPAAASPYGDGEHVRFTGLVTDAGGKPMAGVEVALEAAQSHLSLREMRRVETDARRVLATTNAQGEYTIEWPWDEYFDHFHLLAGVTVRHGRAESLQVLEREDVSDRVEAGSPVVSAIVIHDRGLIARVHEFVAWVRSADEHRVYEEMGDPRRRQAGRLHRARARGGGLLVVLRRRQGLPLPRRSARAGGQLRSRATLLRGFAMPILPEDRRG